MWRSSITRTRWVDRPRRASRPLLALAALGWAASVSAADPLQTVDLAEFERGDPRFTRFFGSVGTGVSGVPVTGGHDLDGDGVLDFAMASIRASPLNRVQAGQVLVALGDGALGRWPDSSQWREDRSLISIFGVQPYEVTGAEIWLGDVDGDGLGDLLIGRQNHSPEGSRLGAGALTILFGSPAWREIASGGTRVDLSSIPPGLESLTIFGASPYDRFGIWMRTGDVTGDGVDEFIVGADEVDEAGEINRGAAYLFRGGAHLRGLGTVDLQEFGATALAGHVARLEPPIGSSRFHFGATVQLADADGDGLCEVMVGATVKRAGASLTLPGSPALTGEFDTGPERGLLFIAWDEVFRGPVWPAGMVFDFPPEQSQRWTRVRGASVNRRFGEEILGGFDCSGDGRMDLFVGDLCGDAGVGPQSGVGYLLYDAARLRGRDIDLESPPEDLALTRFVGPIRGAIGADTAAWGDFDGDGIADVALGNPHDSPLNRLSAGSAHVVYGRVGGWPDEIRLGVGRLPDPEEARVALILGARGQSFGDIGDTIFYSADAADMDGDGRSDLIFNEMVGNGLASGSVDTGNLVILSGAALAPPPPPFSSTIEARLESDLVALTYQRPIWSRVRWALELSQDLRLWSEVDADPLELTEVDRNGARVERVRVGIATSDLGERAFLRVRPVSLR